jgi:hypothetical protein
MKLNSKSKIFIKGELLKTFSMSSDLFIADLHGFTIVENPQIIYTLLKKYLVGSYFLISLPHSVHRNIAFEKNYIQKYNTLGKPKCYFDGYLK